MAGKAQILVMPFAAGTLIATAFFDLLPEAIEESHGPGPVMLWAMGGFLLFFLLDCFFFSLDSHGVNGEEACHRKSTAKLMMVGDGVHTVLDGIIIGVSFLVGPPTGIITSIAILSHEIPQKIGDFAILLCGGIEKKRVLAIQFLLTSLLVPAATLTYLYGEKIAQGLFAVPALAGGFFTYIAAVKIIPTLFQKEEGFPGMARSILLLFGGIGLIGLILQLLSHSH